MASIELAEYDVVYKRPEALVNTTTHYCPGCTHGLIHRLIAEVIDELGIGERSILVAPVGCAVFAYNYFSVDGCEAPHGRAPAMATGLKRSQPDKIVFTYQGDGDLAAIGTNEIIHAAGRGENLTVVFVNNATYGMTGGQMAPTTLAGQVTTSSPYGRDVDLVGVPMRVSELISTIPGAVYVVRRSVHNVANINKTKAAIKTAFQVQMQGLGLSLVEVLSTCPTNWHMPPAKALQWIEDAMIPVFPLGDYRIADAVVPLTKRTRGGQ
ncbi:MAG: 2-oxoglutarate oxidoreductase [Anaerolinea sp.]|mgnify:FL=1|nr:2-oxoglutarate oxidoreductase [Anaerolinea sp.]HRI56427.1 thiamine pyrophosphate-dependent enzyme [Anaerolineae bacterium]